MSSVFYTIYKFLLVLLHSALSDVNIQFFYLKIY